MTSGLHFPCPVTTMATRRVKPGYERAYEESLRGISQVARGFPGHLGVTLLGPHGDPPEYVAIFTFDSSANLERWMTSAEREGWLEAMVDSTLDDGDVQSLTGLEPWFLLPDRTVNRAPPRYKMAVLTLLGVYPMLLGLSLALSPLIGHWPAALRLAVSLTIGIPLMTWGIMPGLSRLFFRWLYPEPERGALNRSAGSGDAK